jgi:hypothetical protein
MSNAKSFTQTRKAERIAKELGKKSLQEAYDAMFKMIEFIISQKGFIHHQINGLEFKNGLMVGVHSLPVNHDKRYNTPEYIELMLSKYSMVVHIYEAWSSPDDGMPPSKHPKKQDIVNLTFYTISSVHNAQCIRNMDSGTIQKGELIKPEEVGGRMARITPIIH